VQLNVDAPAFPETEHCRITRVEVGEEKACAVYRVVPITAFQVTIAVPVLALIVTPVGATGAPCTPATVIEIVAVAVRAGVEAFVAVIVKRVVANVPVGVPVITPVVEFMDNPLGSGAEIV
jgi:hypothetical protein